MRHHDKYAHYSSRVQDQLAHLYFTTSCLFVAFCDRHIIIVKYALVLMLETLFDILSSELICCEYFLHKNHLEVDMHGSTTVYLFYGKTRDNGISTKENLNTYKT